MKAKRLMGVVLSLALVVMLAFGVVGCASKAEDATLNVYVPMGAPALALAATIDSEKSFISGGKDYTVSTTVVAADAIAAKVKTAKADVAVLPVNAAATLLGVGGESGSTNTYGDKYKIAAALTHGNLFLLRKGAVAANALTKVGVKNLAAVPGLTYKIVLGAGNYAASFDQASAGKPWLVEAENPAAMLTSGGADAVVVPEPVCTNLMSSPLATNLSLVKTSLQEADVWGESNGYAQAVIVVRKELATKDFVSKFLTITEESVLWLNETTEGALTHAEKAINALSAARENKGVAVPFTAANLLPSTVDGCNISVMKGTELASYINAYLTKLQTVAPATKLVGDDFFVA